MNNSPPPLETLITDVPFVRREHFYAAHKRPRIGYILERARHIVPSYGYAVVSLEDVEALLTGAHVDVFEVDFETALGILSWPILGKYRCGIRRGLSCEFRRAVLLHEIGHVLGGHFGPTFADPINPDLAYYPVWEKEADLFAAHGILSLAEQRQPLNILTELIRRSMPMADEQWLQIRAPWIASWIVRNRAILAARDRPARRSS